MIEYISQSAKSPQVGTLLRKWLEIYVICEKFLFQ
jgi:hypothetical protein